MKTIQKWTWKVMFLLGILTVGLASCKDDDNEVSVIDGEEKESAWVQIFTTETPEGKVYYMKANEGLPAVLNISDALELGSDVSAKMHGEYVYIVNTSSSTITKWSVNKVTLEFKVEGILSFASTGIQASSTLVFLSEDQAFMSDLGEGVVLEWNPTKMEITEKYDVESALNGLSSDLTIYDGLGFALDGKVAWTVKYNLDICCENLLPEGGATVGVFDVSSGTLTYKKDDRLLVTDYKTFADENGNYYIQPHNQSGMYYEYFDINNTQSGAPFTLLRMDSSGNFDTTFELDYSELFPITYGGRISMIYGNKMVINYDEVTFPENYEARWDWWGDESINHTVVIDLETKEVNSFNAFADYSSIVYMGNFDGVNYFSAYNRGDNGWIVDVLKQNSIDNFTVVTTLVGTVTDIGKLW
ncbi:hypothetical protein Q4Q35_00445 [Flavivirga aquimarina]|uniref:DUF4374 domain-containing protein n=1 Tax=Flavivirga aquimarina TaxID=2027862 RepID=A0ABT8W572_9FLAO|nr:hypothetical protein [Flavivirga aquimarina]MDO5968263.1 hypothetical protein [Flavivirga aquimarina]